MLREPLRGDDLRASLRRIIEAPVRDLPKITVERLRATTASGRAESGRRNGKAFNDKRKHCKKYVTRDNSKPIGELDRIEIMARLAAPGMTMAGVAYAMGTSLRSIERVLERERRVFAPKAE